MGDQEPVVDPSKAVYAYVQVADHIAGQIADGILQPGARLEGERELAEKLGVAVGTLRRAMEELRERGLVVTLPAKGTYVAEPPAVEG
ncbi:winged helix-turn-helix domain-containing protein [Streptomyces sp. NPDC001634]|uniref:winged helix-turn-helix domain-containing protein n=1 Tax=Streptomyces sp. NPDC001634 TaxID=3154390 RepID=UPI003327FD93